MCQQTQHRWYTPSHSAPLPGFHLLLCAAQQSMSEKRQAALLTLQRKTPGKCTAHTTDIHHVLTICCGYSWTCQRMW